MVLNIFCDGGARGNPGPAAIGVVVQESSGTILLTLSKPIGIATNNIAEYTAVKESLTVLKELQSPIESIDYFLDSLLVVNQLNGLFKIKNSSLQEYYRVIISALDSLHIPVRFNHVPREKNSIADKLVNSALDTGKAEKKFF